MKLFSDACEYGLRATLWLGQNPGQMFKVRDIAEGTRSSPGYLVKVLQRMTKAGILSVQRGSNGGFMLQRSAETLTVLEVINAVDPLERITSCPLGLEAHGMNLCPLHRCIDDAMAMIEHSFATLTIAALVQEPAQSEPLCEALVLDVRVQ